jgi:hypothetical protein
MQQPVQGQENETSVTASGAVGKSSTSESNKRCSERRHGQHVDGKATSDVVSGAVDKLRRGTSDSYKELPRNATSGVTFG